MRNHFPAHIGGKYIWHDNARKHYGERGFCVFRSVLFTRNK